jgi:tetratricopeptide (TPR) repeat protein
MTMWADWPSKERAWFASKIIVLLGVLGMQYVTCSSDPDCGHAVQRSPINIALVVCQQEYKTTNDPHTGARLANLWRRSGNKADAKALANNLLATPARSDALQVLGKIDVAEGRIGDGQTKLENARTLHAGEQRHREIAADDQALAGIWRDRKRFAEALRTLGTCITESREAHDRVIEGYCHIAAGAVLSEVGYYAGAQEELDLADPLLVLDRDRADLAVERGTLDLHNGLGPQRLMHIELATVEFERAIKHASAASFTAVRAKAELNLIYALAELSAAQPWRAAEATAHLEATRQLDLDGQDTDVRATLQARIAYRRGNYALATSINTDVFKRLTDDDDRLRIAVMQAEIGLATRSLDDAITWATRGVAIAEAMRSETSAIELRPWFLSVRRQPYELLFTALARAGRLDEALVTFDHWQGRTLLDELARGGATSPATLQLAATQTDLLNRLVPALSRAPVMKLADKSEILAALQPVDVLALFVAGDDMWRISALHGQIEIVNLGALARLQPDIDEFRAHPNRPELGDRLGEKLLGRRVFRRTDETLFVVLDGGTGGEIVGLPVAALRMDGEPLVALRPIVHPARLSELSCVPAVEPRRSLVIADSHGDLDEARKQAKELATRPGWTAAIGAEATSNALLNAGADDHVLLAVHAAVVEPSGGSLSLADRSVSALELSSRHGGPAFVFLAACSSAVANDSELATSLANAFLASGSSQVIGTLRPVHDIDAVQIARAFYRRNWFEDPVRKFADAQAELAKTSNEDWANFMMFGHDTCRRGAL